MDYRHMSSLRTSFLIIAAALALASCTPPPTSGGATGTTVKTPPTTAEVIRKDLVGYVYFDGKVVVPNGAQATVLSPYDLAISEVLTSVGKRVNRGETIVKLSIPSADVAVAQAQANVQSAQSAYSAAQSANSTPVREAQRLLDEARAAERAARADVQSGGSADVVGATEARMAAEAAVAAARREAAAMAGPERQALDAANEYLKDARAGARMANVRSPISGTITSLEAKVGEPTKSKQVLANIVDLDAIRVQGVVPPEHADLVKKGTKVLIALDGENSDPFEGEVREVSVLPPSEGQKSSGYLAVIDFNNNKGVVQVGSIIKRLGVRSGKVEAALVVPIGAVTKDEDGKSVVYVQKGSDWTPVLVETGISDGALIEIKSGLSEGDKVRVGSVTLTP